MRATLTILPSLANFGKRGFSFNYGRYQDGRYNLFERKCGGIRQHYARAWPLHARCNRVCGHKPIVLNPVLSKTLKGF